MDVAEKMGRAPWFQLGALPIFVSKLFGGVLGNMETIVATPLRWAGLLGIVATPLVLLTLPVLNCYESLIARVTILLLVNRL